MKKTVKVIMLPTEDVNTSPIVKWGNPGELRLTTTQFNNNGRWKGQHLYLTSDEEIKEGDWYLFHGGLGLHPKLMQWKEKITKGKRYKIVATTDTTFFEPIPYYPKIPQSFIEAYVKAEGKIDEVQVEYDLTVVGVPNLYDIRTREDNTVIISPIVEYWKNEMEKCKESPYYYYITYCTVGEHKCTTSLTEEEFNKEWKRIGKMY